MDLISVLFERSGARARAVVPRGDPSSASRKSTTNVRIDLRDRIPCQSRRHVGEPEWARFLVVGHGPRSASRLNIVRCSRDTLSFSLFVSLSFSLFPFSLSPALELLPFMLLSFIFSVATVYICPRLRCVVRLRSEVSATACRAVTNLMRPMYAHVTCCAN